jgi:cobalt-zinc-cadmium efflux system outer membrane protein
MVFELFLVAQLSIIPSSPAAADSMTLSDAVALARSASPAREAAQLRARALADAALRAGPPSNPYFDLRGENWSPSSNPLVPTMDLFAVVTQPIDVTGRRARQRELAVSEQQSAAAAVRVVEREVALGTVRAYVQAVRARRVAKTLMANREGLTTLVTAMARRVSEGYAAESDLLKFEIEAARLDAEIARANAELDRGLSELTQMVGAATPIVEAQLVEPTGIPDLPQASDIAAAVLRHPDVVERTTRIESARRAVAFEDIRRFPEPAISAGYKRTAAANTAVLGVSFSIPLFDRNAAARARLRGEQRAYEAEREALVRQLTTRGTSLVRVAGIIADRANHVQMDLLEPADRVRNAARSAFKEGGTDLMRVIDAERVYGDVQRAAVDLRLDAVVAAIEARFAAGEETIP